MSETLATSTLTLAKRVTTVIESVATSSGAAAKTTLVDGSFPFYISVGTTNSPPADDWYNGGTIWFLVAGSTVNSGDTRIISDYAQSTGTFTFPAADARLDTGDTYAVADRTFPRWALRQGINDALSELGGEDLYNTSTTTVTNQMTYDLPAGVYNVIRVEESASTSSPYGYQVLDHWREINDDIAFDENYQPTSNGMLLRYTYRVPFSALTSDSGAIPDLVDPNWLSWAATANVLRWKLTTLGGDDEFKQKMLGEALVHAEKKAAAFRGKMSQMQRPHDHEASVFAVPTSGGVGELSTPGHVRFRS